MSLTGTSLINTIKKPNSLNFPEEVCPAKCQEGGETLTPSFDLIGKI